MQKVINTKLSVLGLALVSSFGLGAVQANELTQTEIARPAPPGQVKEVNRGGAGQSGQSRTSLRQNGPELSFIIRFKEEKDPDVMAKVNGNPSERGALMQARAQQMSQLSGQEISYVRSMGLARTHVFRAVDAVGGSAQSLHPTSRRNVRRMMEVLASDPSVELVEENRFHHPQNAPNDPQYNQQWHYYEAVGGANTEGAWSQGITGQGVVVAVLDTGYRPHTDLAGNLLPGYDMISDSFVGNDGDGRDNDASDPGDWVSAGACGGGRPAQDQDSSWHGTHVAGTIAAVSDNGQGVAGVAYDAQVVPVRVLGRCGGTTADIADGILWASGASVPGTTANQNPADVINMSLGGQGSCQSVTQSAINTARSNGSTVVIASGNSDSNADNFSPGNCSGVVNVASTDRDGGRAYYSNYGSSVTLAAPGGAQSFANDPEGVLSTHNSGSTTPGSDSYRFNQGTSMAAPHVAGVAALVKQALPSATPDQVAQILTDSARSFPASCSGCGVGILDAGAAVQLALGDGGDNGGGDDTGGGGSVDNLSAATGEWNRFTIDIPSGMSTFTVEISGGSGDADLYVRNAGSPTLQNWDCRPYLSGNNEICTIDNPQAGTWHLGVHAYQAYSGVDLEANYQP
ncbi:peptidase S8 [Aliidiomarina sedimenti]|uniref:Peptidase S8 n=1 Tax=Aliidiomarina sedimenti TaxID=1933879 RepID=A0ABY0C0A4_9GAMM|nr:S8 family peptidase [Aliidiomarina sedimenti]RUO30752.1 peptidase S8 [Aliidiomarina sedimenti]